LFDGLTIYLFVNMDKEADRISCILNIVLDHISADLPKNQTIHIVE